MARRWSSTTGGSPNILNVMDIRGTNGHTLVEPCKKCIVVHISMSWTNILYSIRSSYCNIRWTVSKNRYNLSTVPARSTARVSWKWSLLPCFSFSFVWIFKQISRNISTLPYIMAYSSYVTVHIVFLITHNFKLFYIDLIFFYFVYISKMVVHCV